jgi:hypothetical protein
MRSDKPFLFLYFISAASDVLDPDLVAQKKKFSLAFPVAQKVFMKV